MTPPPRIALIVCTKDKLAHTAPAAELYSASPFFRACLAYARAHCDGALVLSAKYGVVTLDRKLEPYSLRYQDLTPREKRRWSYDVTAQLGVYPDARWVVLAGRDYVDGILPREGWLWERPFEVEGQRRMGIGERKRWLAQQVRGER